MIIKQTESHNSYCIDTDFQYISLVHPLFHAHKEVNTQNENFKMDDIEFYSKKYHFIKKYINKSKGASPKIARISEQSINNQIINATQIVFEIGLKNAIKSKNYKYAKKIVQIARNTKQW